MHILSEPLSVTSVCTLSHLCHDTSRLLSSSQKHTLCADASTTAASTTTGYAAAPMASAAGSTQSAGVETCCGVAPATPAATPSTQVMSGL